MPRLVLEKVLRKKKISKRKFAKLLDLEYKNVFRFFREGYNPKWSMIIRWAKALNVRVRDLIEED